uniref:C-type lectin domain-containing protein n=1 Tax=Peromyscus maniculatus bairdii TaxID=230844 RepID=A0A8C8UA49_PERMB
MHSRSNWDMNLVCLSTLLKKIMSHESCHRFSKVHLTSFTICFLLLTILFSIALIGNSVFFFCFTTLFNIYSQFLEEKAIIRELNYTKLECTKQHSFLECIWSCCPKDWKPFSSHCYYISTDAASGRESEEKCSRMGAHLMVIHSQEEQDFITKTLDPKAAYFIGLSDAGHRQWRWVDQTPYNESATFWHPREPNNNDEQCVVVSHPYSSWGWNDIRCSDEQKSVCQMKRIYL